MSTGDIYAAGLIMGGRCLQRARGRERVKEDKVALMNEEQRMEERMTKPTLAWSCWRLHVTAWLVLSRSVA